VTVSTIGKGNGTVLYQQTIKESLLFYLLLRMPITRFAGNKEKHGRVYTELAALSE